MECELQSEEKELGHYQLKRLLGEGGFGEVYEAWDSKLHRSIAIKRLKPKMLSARPETLLDEARMAASLRHPAFVKIFSIDGDADQQSIIMEYVDGNTLRKMGEGEPLSEAVALDIVAQVAEAMQEAHESNLIHGDLKPSNLMLEASGTVRIMDFGLARRIDPQSTESVVLDDAQGTIAYLAPELLTGTRPNERSDVYSLGVVLYEMVTGGRPFPHLNGLALAAAYMQSSSAAWPFPGSVQAPVCALVRAMTDRNVHERLASMHEVRERIGAIRAGQVPRAGDRPRRASPWPRLKAAAGKYYAGMALAAVLAATGGLTYVLVGDRSGSAVAAYSEAVSMKQGMAALATYDRDDSIELAIRSFSTILEHNSDHAAAAAGLSRAYAVRYLWDKSDPAFLQRADASAQRALQLDDQLAFAHAAQGAVHYLKAKYDDALQSADRALKLEPLQAMAVVVKVKVLIEQRKFVEAEQLIGKAISAHPKDRTLLDTLGTLKYHQGDYPAAEAAFRASIAIEPDAVIAYSNLSSALQFQNRESEALQVIQRGLQVRPSFVLYQALGSVLFTRGDYVEAAKAFEKGVQGGGARGYLNWANLGDTLRWIPGREKDGLAAYREAVQRIEPMRKRSPGDPTLTSRLGLYRARLGDHPESTRLTREALAAAPDSAVIHFRAAMVFEMNGDRDSALAALQTAIERKYPLNLISSEPDLIALRRDPRYRQPLPESDK